MTQSNPTAQRKIVIKNFFRRLFCNYIGAILVESIEFELQSYSSGPRYVLFYSFGNFIEINARITGGAENDSLVLENKAVFL